MTQEALRIFISYASVNRWQVESLLVDTLRSGGYEPWIDRKLTPGKPFRNQLSEVISAADLILYAMSPESLTSEWCQWEIKLAFELRKPIVPVILQKKLETPAGLQGIHWVDFSDGPTPRAVAQLLLAVRESVFVPPTVLPNPPDISSGGLMQFSQETPDIDSETPKFGNLSDIGSSAVQRSLLVLRLSDTALWLPTLQLTTTPIKYIDRIVPDDLAPSTFVMVLPLSPLMSAQILTMLNMLTAAERIIMLFVRDDDPSTRNRDFQILEQHKTQLRQRYGFEDRSILMASKQHLIANQHTYWRSLLQSWLKDSLD